MWPLALVSCSASDAIVVVVDAEPVVLADLESVAVSIGGGEAAPERFSFTLRDTPPDCLPLLFAVERDVADEVEIEIVGNPESSDEFTQQIRTAFQSGLKTLNVTLPATCLTSAGCPAIPAAPLQDATADEVDRRARNRVCRVVPSAAECIESGGCYEDTTTPDCKQPCAAPPQIDEPDAPAPPALPAPVVVQPCPAGWSVEDGACAPWPADVRACAAGAFRIPGAATCQPLGACDTPWPADAPAGAIYVQPGASGSGTRASPYGSIEAALVRAGSGATIVLSTGTHTLGRAVTLSSDLIVRGACATETIVAGASLSVVGADITFERLTLDTVSSTGGALRLEGVIVRGVVAEGGAVELEGVAVLGAGVTLTDTRGTLASVVGLGTLDLTSSTVDAADVAWDGGLRVDDASNAIVFRSLLQSAGAHVDGEATFTDVAWRDVTGTALSATNATVTVTRASLRDIDGDAIHHEGGVLHLTDIQILDIRYTDDERGRGVDAVDTTSTFERVAIRRSAGYGARFEGGVATVANLVVDTTTGDRAAETGTALGTISSSVTVTRAAFTNVRHAGAFLRGGSVRIEDLTIDGVAEDGNDSNGRGVHVERGALVAVSRAKIERAHYRAVSVQSSGPPGAYLELTDVTVADTLGSTANEGLGVGLFVSGTESSASVLRGVFTGSHRANVEVIGGRVDLDHVRTVDGRPHRRIIRAANQTSEIDFGGFGLLVQGDGTVVGERFLAEDNRDAAILAINADPNRTASLDLTDVILRGTTAIGDAKTYNMFGAGLAVAPGTTTIVRRFSIDDNFGAGVRYTGIVGAPPPELDLEDGIVSNNGVGLLVQLPEYDVQRAAVRVQYRDNASTLLVEHSGE
ncbi:MAG: hypothetical protein RIT81_15560 [Deltaproteobacteria bacterium]